MIVTRGSLVFFDTSCLIAATGSPSGGSAFVLSLCGRRLLRGAVSLPVLLEAEGNIARKLGDDASARFTRLLAESSLIIAPVPDAAAREPYRALAGEKDDHVVAAAVAVQAPYLMTLDRRLRDGVNDAELPVRAYTPGDFITGVLPAHESFANLRDEVR